MSSKIFEDTFVSLNRDQFGSFKDPKTGVIRPVDRYTWTNDNHVSLQVISYGATITSVKVPDKNGKVEDVVLGYDTLEEYFQPVNPYFGATIGRVANRIADASFTLNNKVYQLSANNGKNGLHGGVRGFDKVIWESHVSGKKVIFSYVSPDGEEGYPGTVLASVSFQLTDENEIVIEYKSNTTQPTPINLTNHSYFNLAGNGNIYEHTVTINADKITETVDSIPTGKLLPVGNTAFDLRVPKKLSEVIHNVPNAKGFDNNFCIYKGTRQSVGFIARVEHEKSGRVLETYSDQPGVQFYTANMLKPQTGKNGNKYGEHSAFCLETQIWPDAVHHDHFPKIIFNPGEQYRHICIYKFLVKA